MANNPTVLLGGVALWAKPTDIRWNFKMKVVETKTVGGKVIQILGTTFGDISVTGEFGQGQKAKGDKEGWESELRMAAQVQAWATKDANVKIYKPLRFVYAPRGWDFQVYVRAFTDISQTEREINPKYTLTLFPVDNGATTVISQVEDAYISRLMQGVGWVQNEFNGPSQADVDATLNGRTPGEYFADGVQTAYEAGQGGDTSGGAGAGSASQPTHIQDSN